MNEEKEVKKPKKIKVWIETGYVGGYHEIIVDVDPDTLPEELEEIIRDAQAQLFDWGWEYIEE